MGRRRGGNAGVAGCSSEPPDYQPPPGALVAGTAQVTVNGQDTGTTDAVQCTSTGSLTTITTGDQASGVTAMVSNRDELTAESVAINNLGGFTGSYNAGLGGTAEGHDDRPNLRHHRHGRRLRHRQAQLPHIRHVRDQGVLLTQSVTRRSRRSSPSHDFVTIWGTR